MIGGIIRKIIGTKNERELRRVRRKYLERVNSMEEELDRLTNKELHLLAFDYLEKVRKVEVSPDEILCEYFALVREISKRVLGLRPFDVQIIGAVVLYEGKIAEMKTGEGKTLVATMPLALTALEGKGCHLVTVNDYLAKRDAMWMGPIYKFLGLSVGAINQLEVSFEVEWAYPDLARKAIEENIRAWPEGFIINDPLPRERLNLKAVEAFQTNVVNTSRKRAYQCDITYGTNNEFAFDYLRDNMKYSLEDIVQRDLYYSIVDEVDSILIDEARTPLIISGPAEESTELYYKVNSVATVLKRDRDFKLDEKTRSVMLTEGGVAKAEKLLGVSNLYDPENVEILHHLVQSIKAHHLFKKDIDYIVKDGKVVIVDEFTGRLMPGRRWSDGLHQAIEAKEGLRIEGENQTLASTSFQNYFRIYKKLAGMTGTAETEAVEFKKIYNLDVVVIPTHKPMIRINYDDVVYLTEEEKLEAVVEEIEECHRIGRPVLVGTTSIERNEKLSKMLKERGIPHQVLNAKQHEREAYIIAQAGREGAVTVATNMAGRGVDIILGGNPEMLARQEVGFDCSPEEYERALKKYVEVCRKEKEKVIKLGGLHITGTERHEARRVDNQLRGRAGRQGDPGSSRFYVSLEDDLMRIFGSDRISPLMQKLGMKRGEPIEHRWVTKAIENAQQRVEVHNFEIRKHLLEYDDVMNRQREVIYSMRREILSESNLRGMIYDFIEDVILNLIVAYIPRRSEADIEGFKKAFENIFRFEPDIEPEIERTDEIKEKLINEVKRRYEKNEDRIGVDIIRRLEKYFLINTLDYLWREQLLAMDNLRESVGLRGYGYRDPLIEYKREGFELFQDMMYKFKEGVLTRLFMVKVDEGDEEKISRLSRRLETVRLPRAPVAAAAANPKRSTITKGKKIGRNEPCPCGSGKKYKKCCGKNV